MSDSVKIIEGINPKMSNEEYHGNRTHISSSALKLMLKYPKQFYRKYVLNEEDNMSGAALDFGSYLHALILEPEIIADEFALFTGAMRRGKSWEEFEKVNNDKIIITKAQDALAQKLLKYYEEATVSLGKQGVDKEVPISSFFTGGKAEETVGVTIDGIQVKVRFDYRKEFESFGSINDVKTTKDRIDTKEQVEAICDAFDYDLSAALYVDAIEKITDKPYDFYFCFISKHDYAQEKVKIYKASRKMLQRGREKYKKAIKLLKEARKTGVYYKNVIEELD